MRIDVHAHYWTEEYLDLLIDLGKADAGAARGIGGAGAELEARLRLMDRAGIEMQVLSACPQSPYGEDAKKAKLGWSHVPPGSRFSSYQIPQYKKLSAAYGPLTQQSINATNSVHPTAMPVPYTGIGFLDIPQFQDLGTIVSEQFSAAIAGQQSVAAALALAQLYAQAVGNTYRTA